MEIKQITEQLMWVQFKLATDEAYTKKDAAADLLQVVKNIEEGK